MKLMRSFGVIFADKYVSPLARIYSFISLSKYPRGIESI
jgi:hypothetical protein